MTSILSLDTTSKTPSLSISVGEEIVLEYNFTTSRDLSASLIPALQLTLNQLSLTLNQIDVFGIAVGPGLFTGIRVGLATLKGLLMAEQKPVVPVVTLEALAYKYAEPGVPIVTMLDARREEVYIGVYTIIDHQVQENRPPQLIHISQLKNHLADLTDFQLLGNGAEVHQEFIKRQFKAVKIYSRSGFLAPEICKITFQRYQSNTYLTDLQHLRPLYIRKPDAEQNRLK